MEVQRPKRQGGRSPAGDAKRKRNQGDPTSEILSLVEGFRNDIVSQPCPWGSRPCFHYLTTKLRLLNDADAFQKLYDRDTQKVMENPTMKYEKYVDVLLFDMHIKYPGSFSVLPRLEQQEGYMPTKRRQHVCSEMYIPEDRCKRNSMLERLLIEEEGMRFLLTADWKFLLEVSGLKYVTEDGQVITSKGSIVLDPSKDPVMFCFDARVCDSGKHDVFYLWLDMDVDSGISTFKDFMRRGHLKHGNEAYNV